MAVCVETANNISQNSASPFNGRKDNSIDPPTDDKSKSWRSEERNSIRRHVYFRSLKQKLDTGILFSKALQK